MGKVLVVGPGRKTRGGITAVIKVLEQTEIWNKHNCRWIETYIDKSALLKLVYFIKSLIAFLFLLPFYNTVHFHISWTVTAYRQSFFFIYAKLIRKKIIIHIHSGAEPIIESRAVPVYRYMFKHADVTIFLAEVIKEEIEKHFEINHGKVIYNPCLLKLEVIDTDSTAKELLILFAGTVTKSKGIFDLLKAFSQLAKNNPKWKLVVAGNGEIEKGEILAKKLNIEDQVLFTGWISGDIKAKYFGKASIFCLPSYTEGFPMAVLDAWAHGIPVITTAVGGLPDILEHGENSLVFEPGNIRKLVENMETLISSRELRQKLSKASIHLSRDLFDTQTFSLQFDELYSQNC